MRRTFWVAVTCAMAIGFAAAMSGCSSSNPANGNYTYNTTSTASTVRKSGERAAGTKFGTWTFTDGALTASLATTNSGVVQYTVNVNATCAAPSSDFGFQLCTTGEGSSCTAGAVACPSGAAPSAGVTFFLKTVEGVALFALTENELHAGIVQGSCAANIAGDYLFAHMGVGSQDLFGMYKLDATITNVTHADFGVRATNTAADPDDREVFYSTGDPGGDITISGATCSNGVWTIPTPSGDIIATLTDSGLFLLNKGSEGGILSFKLANAATLADLSGKTIAGIQFPDNASPSPIAVTFGTPTANDISGSAKMGQISGTTLSVAETATVTIKKASAQADLTLDLTAPVADGPGPTAYASNSHFPTLYATIADIPGLYVVPPAMGDNGLVLLSIGKLNGKLLAFGVVSNDRSPAVNPTNHMPNTGAFIAFEQ